MTTTPSGSAFRRSLSRAGACLGVTALSAALVFGAASAAQAIAPTAGADFYAVTANTPLAVSAANGILANDVDPEGDPIAIHSLWSNGAALPGEELVINPDGSFTYYPPTGFTGTREWLYRAQDATDVSPVVAITFTITGSAANTAPTAGADAFPVTQDVVLVVGAPGVLVNDTDADGDAVSVAGAAAAPAGGALAGESLSLGADGSFSYTPPTGYTGTRTWTYAASDGTATGSIADIVFTISAPAPAGDVAPIGTADAFDVPQDGGFSLPAPGVLANDSDADGDTLTVVGQGYDTPSMLGESLTIWADGSLYYLPPTGFTGDRTWWYQVSDGTHAVKTSITFTVKPVPAGNVAPVANDDLYPISAGAYDTTAPGVLGNDTDADGDPLTVAQVQPKGAGALAGESLVIDLNGGIHYVSPTGYVGDRTWRYRMSDGYAFSEWAEVTFQISALPAVNTAPVANADGYFVVQDTAFTSFAPGYLGNDTDADGDALEWSHLYWPSGGALPGEDLTMTTVDGAFVYTPPTGFVGVRQFMYLATDGTDDSNYATLTFTVQAPAGGNGGGLVPTIPTLNGDDPGTPADSTVPTLASTGVEGAGIAGTAVLAGLLVGGGLIARRTTRREA